ncbi:hypothetical protein BGW41_008272 [Actinomortierella wolfii]|nr:hypothetical protein BGW41_008272 [Actinomortierella wolfii]
MSKLLVVFGATGNQGGSVVKHIARDPVLSKEYRIRAVTRDPSKPEAKALTNLGHNIEVVQGDVNDVSSLERVLKGAHSVFAVTVSIYDGHVEEHELTTGKAIADAAVAAGAQYIIYSSLPSIKEVSGGKYTHGGHFDSKFEVEQYIRSLPIKSSFFSPGPFMQNYHTFLAPKPKGDGSYVLGHIFTPQTQFPLIDIDDTGAFVAAALADPVKFEGKVMTAAAEVLTMEEIVQVLSKASGKKVVYEQIPVSTFRTFLPATMVDYMVDMFLYIQDFGYYGPDTKALVAQTAASARGKLSTLADYLEKHPLNLS